MSSLGKRLKDELEPDLTASPMRISSYHDLPFAIFRYDPADEWTLRRELRHARTRLRGHGFEVEEISVASLLWASIEGAEGIDAVVELERSRGFRDAEDQVNAYLSDRDWCPIADLLAERLASLDPARTIAFLVRVAALAPSIYPVSRLLDDMQGRSRVPAILFYPGTLEGTHGLRFMDLPDHEPMGNYRVKIYA